MTDLAELSRHRWDAIIVGTGMGGATIGYALARAGWRVLFCEKGRSTLQGSDALRGSYPESHFAGRESPLPGDRDILRRAGRQAQEICDLSGSKPRRFIPFIGSGTGGSTALYGMALERFFPADFTPRRHHPPATNSTLPESWPIAYGDLAPFYAAAEQLYGVRGSRDPLQENTETRQAAAAPAFSSAIRELVDFLERKGLHPYHLPLACHYVADCRGCQGYLCAFSCKRDSSTTCLLPALNDHQATLIDECEALRLETDGSAVTALVCRRDDVEVRFTGNIVVLAAGALATPALLLRSVSPRHPNGLANETGLVGKNLMRHFVDLYLVFPKYRHPIAGNVKELGCNDFYLTPHGKFGALQSFGFLPPAAMLVDSMEHDLRHDAGRYAAAAFRCVGPLLVPFIRRLFSRALILATIVEDLPYLHNEVAPAQDAVDTSVSIRYRFDSHAAKRIGDFRQMMRSLLKPYRFLLIKQAESNQRLAHVCGTCRFGADPRTSVLDRNNKAHSVSNLYVADASFFPSSGGTNPALTIAANALRVADHLVKLGKPKEIT